MSLLAPLFLIGLGLLAIPLWLHRLQTDNPERESFASTMLLEASQKRVHVRRKLRHLVLLALRLLLLALLAFAFAKPVLQTSSPLLSADTQTLHLVVVDTTASMGADNRFSNAVDEVEEILEGVARNDLAQLFEFGSTLKQLSEIVVVSEAEISFDSILGQLRPTPVAGDMGVLMTGLSRLNWNQSGLGAEGSALNYKVHIVSDMQTTALPERYADMIPDLPADADIEFTFYPVSNASVENWALDFVRAEGDGLRIGLRGFSTDEKEVELVISFDDVMSNVGGDAVGSGNTVRQKILVPPSGRANSFVSGTEYQAGVNAINIELLVDDQLVVDNVFNLVVDRSPPEPVLMLTSNPFSPASTYLSAVVASISNVSGGGNTAAKSYRLQTESLADFDLRTLERYSWLIVDDIGALDITASNLLIEYVENGGAVFVASGALATSQTELPLTGHSLSTELSEDNRFFSIAEVDQSHPVLSGLEGWLDLNFSRNLSVSALEDDNVLVSLSNGMPLLIEQRRGRGKLLLLTSSLDNQWNNLPIKPLYVSLMSQIAGYFSDAGRLQTQLYAGSAFSLEGVAGGSGQLIDPDGNAVLALGDTSLPGAHRLSQNGFYQVYTSAGDTLIGVNVKPSESNLGVMDEAEIQRWLNAINDGDSTTNLNDAAGQVTDVLVAESKRPIWLAFLLLAALVLVGESVIANLRISRSAAA